MPPLMENWTSNVEMWSQSRLKEMMGGGKVVVFDDGADWGM